MSGIIQNAWTKSLALDMREYSPVVETTSELPNLADLLLPGTGDKFTGEFACLLKLLGQERKSA
jgi:hypothetical protein